MGKNREELTMKPINKKDKNRTSILVLLVIMATIVFVGCSNKMIIEDSGWTPKLTTDPALFQRDTTLFSNSHDDGYGLIRENDLIDVKLWGDRHISGQYKVGPDGSITVPLIGNIDAAGMSRNDLADTISTRMNRFYQKPIIDISIAQFGPRYSYIFGALGSSGAIEIGRHETLLSLIAKAGGIMKLEHNGISIGTPRIVRVFRNGIDMAVIDFKHLTDGRDLRANIAILPEDIIYIPMDATQVVIVMGEVRIPGIHGLRVGMDVSQALNFSGSITEDAKSSEIRVLRKWWDKEKSEEIRFNYKAVLKGKFVAPVILQDQDIVFVPSNTISKVNYYFKQVSPALLLVGLGSSFGLIP